MGCRCVVLPIQAGLVFPRSGWPLHITLVRFDTRETAEAVRSRLDGVLPAQLGFGVPIGTDALFGRDGSVPVSLVELEPTLQLLHEATLEALGPRVHLPGARHNRSNYRPHVTHAGERLRPGDKVRIRQAALVDMRPDGEPRLRRVLAVWEPG
ncbi:2'-5' RNA ligase family protein [Paeniglutamicibacter gangotriensis]|uniref:2'-5' RNA ligase family protein n=1 Tax=Paeniglutamicibacter gangotriensis TaxID=254787 RepID=A0A5B0EE74_9MICC|nr:2'-5' RNA ligase family protein [Paeniglutamicibacter gangotriensis]KAA0977364.1 2'-5' RNA ligase family protein [Paeniglutamicibacter gangotriensis]